MVFGVPINLGKDTKIKSLPIKEAELLPKMLFSGNDVVNLIII